MWKLSLLSLTTALHLLAGFARALSRVYREEKVLWSRRRDSWITHLLASSSDFSRIETNFLRPIFSPMYTELRPIRDCNFLNSSPASCDSQYHPRPLLHLSSLFLPSWQWIQWPFDKGQIIVGILGAWQRTAGKSATIQISSPSSSSDSFVSKASEDEENQKVGWKKNPVETLGLLFHAWTKKSSPFLDFFPPKRLVSRKKLGEKMKLKIHRARKRGVKNGSNHNLRFFP